MKINVTKWIVVSAITMTFMSCNGTTHVSPNHNQNNHQGSGPNPGGGGHDDKALIRAGTWSLLRIENSVSSKIAHSESQLEINGEVYTFNLSVKDLGIDDKEGKVSFVTHAKVTGSNLTIARTDDAARLLDEAHPLLPAEKEHAENAFKTMFLDQEFTFVQADDSLLLDSVDKDEKYSFSLANAVVIGEHAPVAPPFGGPSAQPVTPTHTAGSETPAAPTMGSPAHAASAEVPVAPPMGSPAHAASTEVPVAPPMGSPAHAASTEVPVAPPMGSPAHAASTEVPVAPPMGSPAHAASTEVPVAPPVGAPVAPPVAAGSNGQQDLLNAIRNGGSLRRASERQAQPAPVVNPQDALLNEIRSGNRLRPTPVVERPASTNDHVSVLEQAVRRRAEQRATGIEGQVQTIEQQQEARRQEIEANSPAAQLAREVRETSTVLRPLTAEQQAEKARREADRANQVGRVR